MKKKISSIAQIIFFLIMIFYSTNLNSKINVTNYMVYYGEKKINELSKFPLVIIECRNYSKEEIAKIKKKGTIVICYISLSEEDVETEINKNYYLDKNRDGLPDKNPFWGSYYVNAENEEWQKKIIMEEIPKLISAGSDGFFLDTIDSVDLYLETKKGMIGLIKKIRKNSPEKIIIANRGFSIIKEISSFIDGVMYENLTTRYNELLKIYEPFSKKELKWIDEEANMLKEISVEKNITVFSLDYAYKTQKELIKFSYQRATSYNFLHCISVINLDQIYEI